MRPNPEMALIYRSLLHVRCPDCGKNILVNYTRPRQTRTCLLCGRHVEIPPAQQSRFPVTHFDDLPMAGA